MRHIGLKTLRSREYVHCFIWYLIADKHGRYGYIFLKAILNDAHISAIGDSGFDILNIPVENLDDRTFNFRMKGLNVDFMSFAALSLASHDVEVLLDPNVLQSLSNRVFSTFFQHFVAENVTKDNGSNGFQPLNATLPWDLGPILPPGSGEYPREGTAWSYQDKNTSMMTNKTAPAILHTKIVRLNMAPTAFVLCVVMLCFLVGTTVVLHSSHRHYFKALPRDVDNLASVLGFVYGSPALLKWAEENRGKSETQGGRQQDQDSNNELITKLGWFDGSRWGIEIVNPDPKPDQQT